MILFAIYNVRGYATASSPSRAIDVYEKHNGKLMANESYMFVAYQVADDYDNDPKSYVEMGQDGQFIMHGKVQKILLQNCKA